MRLFHSRRSREIRAAMANAHFAATLDDAPDAVLTLSTEGRVTCMNVAARAMFGADLLGEPLRAAVERDSAPTIVQHLAIATPGAPQRFDVAVPGAGGTRRVLDVALTATATSDDSAFILSARDVTADRHAADELLRSETRYRQLFEAAADAILTIDPLGRFTTVNGAAERISGYTHSELIGKFFGPLLAVESMPRALLEFRRALGGAAGQFETIMLHKSGERRHLTVNYACSERGREVICLIRDATAEKQLQEQLIQAEKMGAIGQLVSGVAHELNNPLASISAFAQLLIADGRLLTEHRHSVDVVRTEAARASRIVNNLLTFARQHSAEKVAADVNTVVQDTLELRRYELNVHGIQLLCDFVDQPPVTMVDVHQLQQVILNLITNAEHAMESVRRSGPPHQLTLRTRRAGEFLRIEVEDTGTGIPAHAMNQIFNPFFTTKPVGKGTGLGLSISLGIVSQHGGRMWAENVANGARFTVELPVLTGGRPMLTPVRGMARVRAASALRILVADDEEPLRTALDRLLTTAGHSVVTVGSGSEAIWRAEGDEEFDAVLLDLRMPDVSGQLVFERWRVDHPELSDRVVFITGDVVSADLQLFLRGTGRPYVAKPFDLATILELLPARRIA